METLDFGQGLRALHELGPTAVADSVARLAHDAGAVDVVVYLVDYEQAVLTPVPARDTHVGVPVSEPVTGPGPGEAFRERRLVREPRPEGERLWVPIFEAADCTGVIALTVGTGAVGAGADEVSGGRGPSDRWEELGMLAGAAIAVAARHTDLYNLVRRRKAMSLPASMQWDLLPPLRLSTPEVSSVGALEPAYDVGGDSFDHAVNGLDLDVAVMDAMGHGLGSSLLSALAMGTYRHERREGQSLVTIHQRLDRNLAREHGGERFVTGQVVRLALRSGKLTWINAGHPAPLLVRRGRVERELLCRPSLPWGLGGEVAEVAVEMLRPGDAVLFHTDGITEGRSPGGEPFGAERLHALVERVLAEGGPPGSTARRLISEVLSYQDHRLRDDATLVWLTWDGPA